MFQVAVLSMGVTPSGSRPCGLSQATGVQSSVSPTLRCRTWTTHLRAYTDEASFTRENIINSCNSHVWAVENSHPTIRQGHQRRVFISVWCGIPHVLVLGPYMLDRPCLQGFFGAVTAKLAGGCVATRSPTDVVHARRGSS
jgi:hypothetical protein